MPDMAGRTEVLLKLLPSSREDLSKMSRGKRTQLEIILRSLETPGRLENHFTWVKTKFLANTTPTRPLRDRKIAIKQFINPF